MDGYVFIHSFSHSFILVFQGSVSVCSFGYPRTYSEEENGPELTENYQPLFQMLELKLCDTTAWYGY